ncbi:Serine/threonine-protein kinase PknD [compost metagenome]
MKTRSLVFALGLTLLAGCASLPPFFQPVPAALVANGDATLRLSAEIAPGGYGMLATISPYTPADVHHVTLTVFKLDGSTEIPLKDAQGNPLSVRLSQAQLSHEVAFAKLWRMSTYRIKARAYADAAETQLISKAGASDQIDVVVSGDDRPPVARIKVSLIDKAFDGQATVPGITFTPGSVANGGTPGIKLEGFVVSTFAGSTQGYADGTGTAAKFYLASGIEADASGNLYVTDNYNYRIRKITPQGVVTTFAGLGTNGTADGTSAAAQFSLPNDLTIDAAGTIYVADWANHRIRKIDPVTGQVTTVAGSTQGFADGIGSAAKFNNPYGIAVDAAGTIFVADGFNSRIRKINPVTKQVSTFAGSGTGGNADGTGAAAQFSTPLKLTFDTAGNLYVSSGTRIRKITPAAVVTTVAGSTQGYADGIGTAAQFNNPYGLAFDPSGKLYVTESSIHRIRMIDLATQAVTTIAGSGTAGKADGLDIAAQFNAPSGLAIDASGSLYVADRNNHLIRKLTH